jgi:RNA polymerase sigma-70 factor (ECF subfamily)
MAYRIVGNRDDAEDAVQEAWLKAYAHLNTFEGRSEFSTWLTRITINSALMTLRGRRRTHPEASMETALGETWQQWSIADRTRDPEDKQYLHW